MPERYRWKEISIPETIFYFFSGKFTGVLEAEAALAVWVAALGCGAWVGKVLFNLFNWGDSAGLVVLAIFSSSLTLKIIFRLIYIIGKFQGRLV